MKIMQNYVKINFNTYSYIYTQLYNLNVENIITAKKKKKTNTTNLLNSEHEQ